jgi:hypothetical protein
MNINLKNILILIGLTVMAKVNCQVRIVNSINNSTAINSSAFIDASSNNSINNSTNLGKGLLYPRTDLTTFANFGGSPIGIATSYPTRFDGLLVYNTGTGNTLASAADAIVAVTPGFWYYDNKSTTLKGGTWKPIATSTTGGSSSSDILKEDAINKSTDGTFSSNSDIKFPTEKATKTFVKKLTNSNINIGNAANVATEVVVSGDASINNSGVLTINDNAITTSKILDGTITNSDLNKPTIPISGFGAAEADIDIAGYKVTGVALPTDNDDATNKQYVDERIASATTTNSTLLSIKTSNYTIVNSDYTILCNAVNSGFTVTLPEVGTSINKILIIKKIDVTNNIITFAPNIYITNSETISELNYPKSIKIQSNGTNWYIIN